MAYEDYTVDQFEKAWFKGNRDIMDEETFSRVYTEYIDTSGLFDQEIFDKSSYIQYLNGRINSIKMAIRLQREFINNFDVPFLPELVFFKKFGHILFWNNDKEKFVDALKKIEQKEKKYISQVENEIKELVNLKAKKNSGEITIKQTQISFVRTLNSLNKIGYKIEKKETTVQELSLMIKQQIEENEAIKNKH